MIFFHDKDGSEKSFLYNIQRLLQYIKAYFVKQKVSGNKENYRWIIMINSFDSLIGILYI